MDGGWGARAPLGGGEGGYRGGIGGVAKIVKKRAEKRESNRYENRHYLAVFLFSRVFSKKPAQRHWQKPFRRKKGFLLTKWGVFRVVTYLSICPFLA